MQEIEETQLSQDALLLATQDIDCAVIRAQLLGQQAFAHYGYRAGNFRRVPNMALAWLAHEEANDLFRFELQHAHAQIDSLVGTPDGLQRGENRHIKAIAHRKGEPYAAIGSRWVLRDQEIARLYFLSQQALYLNEKEYGHAPS